LGSEGDLDEHSLNHSDLVQLDGNVTLDDCFDANEDFDASSSIPVIISSRPSSTVFEGR
jgi:hypothetical protein